MYNIYIWDKDKMIGNVQKRYICTDIIACSKLNEIELITQSSMAKPRPWWMDQVRIGAGRSNWLLNVGEQIMMENLPWLAQGNSRDSDDGMKKMAIITMW
jgi:hypothetical protein